MRTINNWGKHELLIEENELVTIHHLKMPGTETRAVKFINTQGLTVVTGDYGNWVFCRSFLPKKNQRIDDQFWLKELELLSTQKGNVFSTEKTEKGIKYLLEEGLKEYGYEDNELEEATHYCKLLLEHVDSRGEDYQFLAHNRCPSFFDFRLIPYEEETHYWLKAIFDAFEEICKRLDDKK